jgi:hypothetical protein
MAAPSAIFTIPGAVARAEGGEDADPIRWGALLTT